MVEKEVESRSEPWNIAKGYVTLKILHILVENDKLINIAFYGCENIEYSTIMDSQTKIFNRIEALKRIHTNLEKIFSNSEFAIKKADLPNFKKYQEKINEVGDVLDGISSTTEDQRIHQQTIEIEEEHFKLCLKKLRDVMKDMNIELNNANLIFPSSDDFDMDDIKEMLIHGG